MFFYTVYRLKLVFVSCAIYQAKLPNDRMTNEYTKYNFPRSFFDIQGNLLGICSRNFSYLLGVLYLKHDVTVATDLTN